MTEFIAKHFVRDYKNITDPKVRDSYGVVASIFGLISNVILFVVKLLIGFIFSSMAIISDALNNMADFGNSSVSLIGFKLSKKPGDKEHPYGHARIEYLASLIIAFIIVIVGVIACVESIHDAIDHINDIHSDIPTLKDLAIMLPIFGVALLIKLFQALLYRGFNKKIHSITFKGLAADSRNDMITTTGVIISILIGYFTKVNIDGYVGALVALLVIYSGLSMAWQSVQILIGEKPDEKIVAKFVELVKNSAGVLGIHDLEMHCYGPHVIHAVIHVEVDANQSVMVLHDLLDGIERRCEKELGIKTVIHMDPVMIQDPQTEKYKTIADAILKDIDPELSLHDFRLTQEQDKVKIACDVRLSKKYLGNYEELKTVFEQKLQAENTDLILAINYDQPYEDLLT